jgi:hypothetical protein
LLIRPPKVTILIFGLFDRVEGNKGLSHAVDSEHDFTFDWSRQMLRHGLLARKRTTRH